MKKIILILFIMGGISSNIWATPQFKDYKTSIYQGRNQAIKLDQNSRQYQTMLVNMSKRPVNAGNYVLEPFGCGGGCTALAAYNAKTGQGFILKDQFSDCYSEKYGFVGNDIQFEKESHLVIAIGRRSTQIAHCEAVYYVLKDNRFREIQQNWIYKK